MRNALGAALVGVLFAATAGAQNADVAATRIPSGAKVFIAPMNGFETYLMAAFTTKKVPLVVVGDRDQADFEMVGASESARPGWVRTLTTGDTGTDEQASIAVKNVRTRVVAFGYAVNLKDSLRGKQSAAESCAKHLKDKIERDAKAQPVKSVAVASPSPSTVTDAKPVERAGLRRTITARVQSDSADEDFVGAMKAALATHGIDLRTVGPSDAYDYNIVFTRERTASGPAAAVVVLDSHGNLLVSAAHSGIRTKGAAGGAAEDAATRLAATLR